MTSGMVALIVLAFAAGTWTGWILCVNYRRGSK